ncbi:MAG: helix-turn-helix domain-containing protein [Candidatus Edwardsbacteria bacterium]|nr:helix-turn-helix domain-containing protein [Candidatus Edwardsbacteria bacterium]
MKKYRKIKSMMVLKGIKNTDVAARAGVADVTVSVVLTGRRRSKNIETAIADLLGCTRDQLWPPRKSKAA